MSLLLREDASVGLCPPNEPDWAADQNSGNVLDWLTPHLEDSSKFFVRSEMWAFVAAQIDHRQPLPFMCVRHSVGS